MKTSVMITMAAMLAGSVWAATNSDSQSLSIPGLFKATGSMTTPRLAHTAILLPNGKVY
jgi:hypothetical protein